MMTSSETLSENLAKAVTAVPGVRGLEPGILSAVRVLHSQVLGERPGASRFGVRVDDAAQEVHVDLGVEGSREVRQTVSQVQREVEQLLASSSTQGYQVRVHVKSVS